jgi:feruloyl esterase
MPKQWNRRFFFQGGGGSDGMVLTALGLSPGGFKASNGLQLGFAVVSMDAGHITENSPLFIGGGLFALEPEARLDYGYKALGTMTIAAKQIVERVYGTPIERSYFVGCSNGGRQAMVAAARFPEQFDGIVAGDPGFRLPQAAVQHAWDYQQLLGLDAQNPAGAFTSEEMAFLGERINAKCDALDGAVEGMVHAAEGCSEAFDLDLDVPTCPGTQRGGSCCRRRRSRSTTWCAGRSTANVKRCIRIGRGNPASVPRTSWAGAGGNSEYRI